MSDLSFMKFFFRALQDEPLEVGDDRYVRLYDEPILKPVDPVRRLARAVEFSEGTSIQLLSGFRGTGKTTELRRLEATLVNKGYKVIFIDMDEYLNMTTPIDISDFLMAIAGAFGEALAAPHHLGKDATLRGYWERFGAFLTNTQISLPEASISGIKANLKSDPTFKELLQKRMEGHIGALEADVHHFIEEGVKALKVKHGMETEVVLIVDSLEHLRGSSSNADKVQASVEVVFAGHAERLRLPYVHVIYTVPTYLKVLSGNIGMLYPYGAVEIFPAIKVHDDFGKDHPPGIQAMMRIVQERGKSDDWKKLLGTENVLEEIVKMSGGNIRDLLRIVREIILRAQTTPVDDTVVQDAINQIRAEFLPIADDDALWLERIARENGAGLLDIKALTQFSRFLDTHAVLCYRNGHDWYNVHPLIRDVVREQVEVIKGRKGAQP